MVSPSTTTPARSASSGCGHRSRPSAGAEQRRLVLQLPAHTLRRPTRRSSISRTVDLSVSIRLGRGRLASLSPGFDGERRQRVVTPPDVDPVRGAGRHARGASGGRTQHSTRRSTARTFGTTAGRPRTRVGAAARRSIRSAGKTPPPRRCSTILCVRPVDVDPDANSMEHVEVLERDVLQVSDLEFRQRGQRRLT